MDSDLFQTLNLNSATFNFINSKLSTFMIQILNSFIEIKSSIDVKVNSGDQSKDNSYSFYFSFNNTFKSITSVNLEWQKFLFIDKFNHFVSLFFINYEFEQNQQQISKFLTKKHWDFILCYTTAISQSFNKLDQKVLNESKVHLLTGISFFQLTNRLVKCINTFVRDDLENKYPNQIFTEWTGLFSKEIFDPLLSIFLSYSKCFTNFEVINQQQNAFITSLSCVVSLLPYERVLFNDLPLNFSVLDSLDGINLTDCQRSMINHFVPYLCHPLRCVQLASYKITSLIMKKVYSYYKDDNDNEDKLNIFQSLPFVVQQTFKDLSKLFADLKDIVSFEENILVIEDNSDSDSENEIDDDLISKATSKLALTNESESETGKFAIDRFGHKEIVNNRLVSYLLINRLILDMFTTDDHLEFKVKLVNELREMNFTDYLMNCLFRLMPDYNEFKTLSKYFSCPSNDEDIMTADRLQLDDLNDIDDYKFFTNKNVQIFACRLYKYTLKCVPAMIRDW
jgi:hypothetical protein